MLAVLLILSTIVLVSCDNSQDGTVPDDSAEASESVITADPHTLFVGDNETYPALLPALTYIKEQRTNGDSEPFYIKVKSGEYRIEDTIELDESMSDVTIEAIENGSVAFVGGYRVTGWINDTFNGIECLSAPVNSEDFSDFYVNGKIASMTRYPQEGYLTPEELEDVDDSMPGSMSITVREGDIPELNNIEKVQFSCIHKWVDEHTPVISYDPETRRLSFAVALTFDDGECDYWLDNVEESFGRPNDWYVKDNRIYYVPADDSVTPDTIEAYVPTIDCMFNINGKADHSLENFTLRGLTFRVTRGDYITNVTGTPVASDNQAWSWAPGYIQFTYSENCTIENCTFTDYGINGIVLDDGCRNNRISNCQFLYGGGGCVKIRGGDDESAPDATNHNTVEDCTMLYCGQRRLAASAIIIMRSGNNTIEHNEIGYINYSGITNGWSWGYDASPTHDNLITKNYIHNIGNGMLSDMGGIYSLGKQPGTVISYNLIHDVKEHSYGGNGIYCDQGSSDMVIENNIVYNIGTNAFQQSMGDNNIIRNNIFASSTGALFQVWAYEEHHSVTIEHNIFYSTGSDMYELRRDHLSHRTAQSSNNLFFSTVSEDPVMVTVSEKAIWNLEQIQKFYNMDSGSIVADPEFTDFNNHDFTLKDTSPALTIGFEPFDLSDAGPRK